VNRRELLVCLGSAAALPPAVARAQQREQMRRIGVLTHLAADDPIAPRFFAAFEEGLRELGWIVGANIRIDYRWGAGDTEQYRKYAQELVALAPDVILATAGSIVGALQQVSRTVPIVFVTVIDPVGGGWVASLARPGGKATGFSSWEFSLSGKWLELLKQLAPAMTRVAVIRDPTVPAGAAGFGAIQTIAPSFRVEVTPVGVHAEEIEPALTEFARSSNGGLIVVGPPSSLMRDLGLIIRLAARHRLPAIYPVRRWVSLGGLMSYGPETADQYRRAAGYVDRILKGEKPADLPVQAPTKYELAINMKTAEALGLTVPPSILARADEVIE
jgi:putative tryptophan/tyrosine transport system substrate-binding protein